MTNEYSNASRPEFPWERVVPLIASYVDLPPATTNYDDHKIDMLGDERVGNTSSQNNTRLRHSIRLKNADDAQLILEMLSTSANAEEKASFISDAVQAADDDFENRIVVILGAEPAEDVDFNVDPRTDLETDVGEDEPEQWSRIHAELRAMYEQSHLDAVPTFPRTHQAASRMATRDPVDDDAPSSENKWLSKSEPLRSYYGNLNDMAKSASGTNPNLTRTNGRLEMECMAARADKEYLEKRCASLGPEVRASST